MDDVQLARVAVALVASPEADKHVIVLCLFGKLRRGDKGEYVRVIPGDQPALKFLEFQRVEIR